MRAIIFNLVAAVVNARGGSKGANPRIQKGPAGMKRASTHTRVPNRVRWFRAFAVNVSQIYDADEEQPVEMKIELEAKEAAN
jgi:hypothetical protein